MGLRTAMADPRPARKLKAHIFICTHERPAGNPRGCCKDKNSVQLVQGFKEELAKRGLLGQVRAQQAGCLDACEFGASMVVYPENVWYGGVRQEDIAEIIEDHIVGGKPLERLRIPGK